MHAHVLVRRGRRRQRRRWWSRAWLSPERRRQFGLYDQLMVELRREDSQSFTNFMQMPPQMFDKVLRRIGPRMTKQHTFCRAPIEPGMKLAIALRHLASGSKYTDMHFGQVHDQPVRDLEPAWLLVDDLANHHRCWRQQMQMEMVGEMVSQPSSYPSPFLFQMFCFALCCLSPWCGFFRITGRCVIKVTNPASLYTLHCVRHMTCSHTLAVRFARYTYCTCSVCALHVR